MIGGYHEARISAIAMKNHLVLTAAGNDIYLWKRNALVARVVAHESAIIFLMFVGDEHCLSVSGSNPKIRLWSLSDMEMVSELEGLDESAEITCVIHPDTYLNKILFGTRQGHLELWNVNNSKKLFVYDGWDSSVLSLAQSDVLDVIGVGLEDGRIILLNIKFNEVLLNFKQAQGPVCSLAFRRDGCQQLISSSPDGSMIIWDLDAAKMISVMKHAHHGMICGMQFFVKEPILVTTGSENSIKMWIFDQLNDKPRVLRSRVGHSKIPSKVRFSHMGAYIYSGSQDGGFHMFCTVRDQRSREFSQGHLDSIARKSALDLLAENLRVAPISAISFSIPKIKRWDSIITAHKGSLYVHAWRRDKFAISNRKFKSTEKPPKSITAVELSYSGHYAIIGSSSGWIDAFNVQSGLHRGTFPQHIARQKLCSDNDRSTFHKSSITGLMLDIFDQILVSASLDGHVKFWDFAGFSMIDQIDVGSPILMMESNKESSLIVLADDLFVIHVIDIFNRVCVRRFNQHTSPISDIALSLDSKWIVSASNDCTVRVWDIITGRCINWLLMPSPVVSLSLSPSADYLVTAHVNSRGLFIWANQSHFSEMYPCPVSDEAPLRVFGHESYFAEQVTELPNLVHNFSQETTADEASVNPDLISLSDTSASKWKTLVNLDVVIERSQPIDAPKNPQQAPFILKTLPGLKNKYFLIEDETNEKSVRLNMSQLNITTPLMHQLLKENKNFEANMFSDTIKSIQQMTCSALDFEIRSVNLDDKMSLNAFLNFFIIQLKRNVNYELVQALLNIFLKHQGEALQQVSKSNPDILESLSLLRELQSTKWKRLECLLHFNLCLVNFLLNIPM